MLPNIERAPEGVCGREPLLNAVSTYVAHRRVDTVDEIRASLEETFDAAGPEAFQALSKRLSAAGLEWGYYPGDPLVRRIHHVLAEKVLRDAPTVSGADQLMSLVGRPIVLVANHLSYSDANVVEVLLHQAGASAIADRLTVVAGPKVYSNIRRRFSSLCFGTIRVPQSASRSSEDAVMRPRDVAVAARRAIQIAHERLRLGEVLLVFGEGTRSRTASMHPFLPGVARYLDLSDVVVVPLALEGTEGLFPLDEEGLTSVPLAMRVGRPVDGDALRTKAQGDRRVMMDALGFAVAKLVAEPYRGVYGDRLERARAYEVSMQLFERSGEVSA